MSRLDWLQREFEGALLSLNPVNAREIAARAHAELPSSHVIDGLVVPVLQRIGVGWEQGDVSLAQVYLAGRLCEELVDAILPPVRSDRRQQPKIAIAVLEDHHQLGKRVVYSMLRAGGFELLDYGHGLKVADLATRVIEDDVQVLLVSTLMLRSALMVKELKAMLRATKPEVKVVVGGAPFRLDSQLWKEVDADAMGRNGADAVEIVSTIVGNR